MTKLYAVGLGPGGKKMMTEEAVAAISKADVICGYTVYVDLVASMFPEKETFTTAMRKEIDRCRWALETAQSGRAVAMVCSGDSGVYGMAGLLIQMVHNYPDVEIEVVPGITAAISGAAVLGAPVGHDFCVISLSDLLTPWDLITKRLKLAAEGDFITCLYNPRSTKRVEHLNTACEIMLKYRSKDTICGWVKNIGRDGEECKIVRLEELADEPIDMFTTVFIGSSQTKIIDGKMVTPRGYEKHEDMSV